MSRTSDNSNPSDLDQSTSSTHEEISPIKYERLEENKDEYGTFNDTSERKSDQPVEYEMHRFTGKLITNGDGVYVCIVHCLSVCLSVLGTLSTFLTGCLALCLSQALSVSLFFLSVPYLCPFFCLFDWRSLCSSGALSLCLPPIY